MASATDSPAGFRPLDPAPLTLRDGSPWCARYGDVYYSPGEGAQESAQVFLAANGLPERWRDGERFTVGETGFGTGLNFLLTWDLWRSRPGRGWLHYLSTELHPFTPPDMARLMGALPAGLRRLGEQLLAQYPEPVSGYHRLVFPDDRVSLTLLFGDATETLAGCHARVDAWYLDGFAPARNPGLWNEALYAQLARLTPPGGTLASFTAAGHVRRGLEAAGFRIVRQPGFGAKRERITGVCESLPQSVDVRPPWLRWPEGADVSERRAAVIGAGLAGTSTALALSRRGWDVTVLDSGPGPAAGASGNPAGIIMAHLSADHGVVSRFTLQAAEFAWRWIESVAACGHPIPRDRCGALWLADGERLRLRLDRIAERLALPHTLMQRVDAPQAAELAGVPLTLGGLYLPRAGWVDPSALCRGQLEAASARLVTGVQVSSLRRTGDAWHVLDANGKSVVEAPQVVLANGLGLPALHPGIETRPLRGQLGIMSPAPSTQGLRRILCYEGYVTPATPAGHVFGATYVRGDTGTDLRAGEHARNLSDLARVWPAALSNGAPANAGRAAVRYNAAGRLPLVGPLPRMDAFEAAYADLHHGRSWDHYPDAPCLPGVYATLAHGSRGLTTTPLAAEVLASLMHGDPLPLSLDLVEALHTARERVRQLKRRP
ncbi:bifunctional tRNA (5-methylaminomethyl-2-thiouridine)(34)-methyltransferase MnmD/FAD-dependent 5-carboxymethylaminomethyl-2-thiouridine(34) oxidoreductase MnmC [Thioalkalivibrio denitrificans]|uniref:tRNA 5-methylaminomethyl-2-thiouridine biosynthesis bifunctional protein MnmC n=1 Tax=Thioalkalivibrio denitrificans TaxID=108003 RepID=A0A1V3NRI8_9GAMM|nr:bifunctional tRNA (5-methylaminomethyl-2-thiouridine)(34)-methyltransferase MnmD/FAD-dependent 5-carboxymethylaminomethyl-2-thiouridine(34) oxidoreductase MnmC [Thioalkalivibrio denitrificans]OOG27661.1 bifunctional tRNA (5-methylaminomethyl-2-thiouridine)(34)-methyltransferase MnmD/FAD-dependent 5-carboxymethylaminomethyl-2-thiouridine(34) oxidoreductase MnmC [Thioalkalivibrio denitrificans]